MWRRKHNPRRADNCGLLLPRLVMPLVGVSPFASSLGPSCLLASYALRASSAHRLALASYRPAPRLIDKRGGAERSTATSDGEQLLACLGWRRGVGGHRRRMAAGCGCGCGCLLASWRWTERLDRSSIVPLSPHRLIQSTRPRLLSSSHRPISSTGRRIRLSLFARPLPACSHRLACLGLFPRPRPGDAWAAAWLAAAGGRSACLRSRPRAALSLPLVRSLLYDLCRSCRSFLLGVLWGVLWAILPAILSALVLFNICP